jgi:hypothetical protein
VGDVLSGFNTKSYNIVWANEIIRMPAIGVNSLGNALAEDFTNYYYKIVNVC